MNLIEGADATPTSQAMKAVADQRRALDDLLAKWNEMKNTDLRAFNDRLTKANLPPIKM